VEADESRATALAILPLGTANDLARSCRIPLDPFEALRLAVTATPVAVDVGRANGRAFMNVATGGFGTQVTVATPNDLKKVFGGAAYFLTGLTQFTSIRPAQGRFSGPGLDWEGEFLVLGIGNGRQAGGGIPLCPNALIDDGLLDLTVLPAMDHAACLDAFGHLLREGAQGIRAQLVTARSPWIVYESERDININLDGEPVVLKRFRVETRRRVLPVHLGESELLSGINVPEYRFAKSRLRVSSQSSQIDEGSAA